MRNLILICAILKPLLAFNYEALEERNLEELAQELIDMLCLADPGSCETLSLEDLSLEDLFDSTTAVMPAATSSDTTTIARTTKRVITISDQKEKIENHRSKFISLCHINYVPLKGPWHKNEDELCASTKVLVALCLRFLLLGKIFARQGGMFRRNEFMKILRSKKVLRVNE